MPPMNNTVYRVNLMHPVQTTGGIFAYLLVNGNAHNMTGTHEVLVACGLKMFRSRDGNLFSAQRTTSDLNLSLLGWAMDEFTSRRFPTYIHALVNLFLNQGYHLEPDDVPGNEDIAMCAYAAMLVIGFGCPHNIHYDRVWLEFNRRATGVVNDGAVMYRKFDGTVNLHAKEFGLDNVVPDPNAWTYLSDRRQQHHSQPPVLQDLLSPQCGHRRRIRALLGRNAL